MFVAAGESLIDLVVQPDGRYFPAPGGAPFNFACAMALQGVPTGYLNPLSTDAFGRLLLATLTRAGAVPLGPEVTAPTSLAVVNTDAQGVPSYGFYRTGIADRAIDARQLEARLPPDAIALHTGGLALVPPDDTVIREVMRHMRAKGLPCTLDVNARPAVMASLGIAPDAYRAAVLDTAALATVVKVSDEDLMHLGLEGDVRESAATFLDRGSALVVLTLGERGAVALGRGLAIEQPAARVDVVDSVGAGDCFFAGFLAHLLRHHAMASVIAGQATHDNVRPALHHATACAAINLQRQGCQPATWDEAVAMAATLRV
jgi:fructokinase